MSDAVTPERRDPWLKWFPSDWRADPKVRSCSLASRGLWLEMLNLMHEATPYGHLTIGGRAMTVAELARQAAATEKEVANGLKELKSADVYSLTTEGVIYSRRMVRTAKRSSVNRANGKTGGNPALLNKGVNGTRLTESSPPSDNTQKPEARSQTPIAPVGVPQLPEESIAGEFLERIPETYAKCRSGAVYRTTNRTFERDFGAAVDVARLYPNIDRLLSMYEIFLRRTDIGPKNNPGTPGQFAHMAPDCDRLLRENGR
jgi:hypothetical protein